MPRPKRLVYLPLDSRPVCYEFPLRLFQAAGIEPISPSPHLLGRLKQPADEAKLSRWIKHQLSEAVPCIIGLDTILYGGLITSRIGHESYEKLRSKAELFLKLSNQSTLMGFSSILRIPNYNNAEEEPEYWATYGRLLYQYSELLHQSEQEGGRQLEAANQAKALSEKIPSEILDDFLKRRTRNLMMNEFWLDQVRLGHLKRLIFCQDDTGPWGLNVQEATQLKQQIEQKGLKELAYVQTGADELAMTLGARWLGSELGKSLSVEIVYSDPEAKTCMARYDGLSIEEVLNQQREACGLNLLESGLEDPSASSSSLRVFVHTPMAGKPQGDHAMEIPSLVSTAQRDSLLEGIQQAQQEKQPWVLIDLSAANGGDVLLMDQLLQSPSGLAYCYGLGAWNTSGNASGSALATATLWKLSELEGRARSPQFKICLMIRVIEDWYYQGRYRQTLRLREKQIGPQALDESELYALMSQETAWIKSRLGLDHCSVSFSFPCNRSFEIAVHIESA